MSTEIGDIPTLTDTIPTKEAKSKTAFHILFFNAEVKVQQLAMYGHRVTRSIAIDKNGTASVTYNFSQFSGGPNKSIVIFDTDPFVSREELINTFNDRLAYLQRQKKVHEARVLLEKSLTPVQLQSLRELADQDLVFAVTGHGQL